VELKRECPGCGQEFEVKWELTEQEVTCTHCDRSWEVDWDYTDSDGGYSVWLTGKEVEQSNSEGADIEVRRAPTRAVRIES
jgi:hypothetical protein